MTKLIQNIKVRDQIYNFSLLILLCKKYGSMLPGLLWLCQDCRGANSITQKKKKLRESVLSRLLCIMTNVTLFMHVIFIL